MPSYGEFILPPPLPAPDEKEPPGGTVCHRCGDPRCAGDCGPD